MTPRKPPITVLCVCGRVLEWVRPNRTHCGVSCRMAAYRRRKGEVMSRREVETLTDLEALIAEQMQHLPPWWGNEVPNREKP